MKILLFNDNPVVRKLVALSAQKTKDDLSVIWSVDEVEESGYDLVIIDDALYSDEMFESLKEHITFRSALLMATRGKAIPAGFDNVINKPFLPTDLVDMFIQIEKKFSESSAKRPEVVFAETPIEEQSPVHAINLEETLPDLAEEEDTFDSFDLNELDDLGEELEFNDGIELDTLDEDNLGTAILDKEEVQEVQGLLEDTESDNWDLEDEITLSGIDESNEINLTGDNLSIADELGELEPVKSTMDELDEMNFEEDDLESMDDLGTLAPADDAMDELDEMSLSEDDLGLNDGFGDIESLADDEDFDFADELVPTPESAVAAEEEVDVPQMDEEDLMLLDDDGLDDLEAQIQSAVDNMESDVLDEEVNAEDFDMPLDESILEELNLPDLDEDDQLGGLDELDMLDERELKLAIGEEVEDLPEADEVEEEELFVPEETSFEEETTVEALEPVSDEVMDSGEVTHAEGVEALQALLKALSNEEVAKSLKGLNISININFGNEK
ncbi:hypothetical protein [Sulfuricurvum sp.]|uniref:hypothetical protein n=1 Tax=Sulfuricurvum sp. TaxID=2025608 RepID=UPI002D4D8903|nr:hypothetical protein [Sulfuricurvum sp.]HZF69269.1 hypothetical protein [Sulfuricurvum sp.]